MEKWQGKIAVVTGAGMGNGARIIHDLAEKGMNVIAIDFTDEAIAAIDQASKNATLEGKGTITSWKCDVRNEEEVIAAFNYIETNFGGVDVLINNAAICHEGFFCDMDINLVRDTLDTNLMGIVYCTRQTVASLKKRGTLGHIIMMNSISGLYIPNFDKPAYNMYPISKHALTAFVEIMMNEFRFFKLNIKITNFSTGVVDTSLIKRQNTILTDDAFFKAKPLLSVEDVSEGVLDILSSPPHVQINEVILRPLHEEL